METLQVHQVAIAVHKDQKAVIHVMLVYQTAV